MAIKTYRNSTTLIDAGGSTLEAEVCGDSILFNTNDEGFQLDGEKDIESFAKELKALLKSSQSGR